MSLETTRLRHYVLLLFTLCCMPIVAQNYSMVVVCKDGTKNIINENNIDSIYFCNTKTLAASLPFGNGGVPAGMFTNDIDLNGSKKRDDGFYHVTIPCMEGAMVTLYKFNRSSNDKVIIFRDCNGIEIESHQNGIISNEWSAISAVAPKNTIYLELCYFIPDKPREETKASITYSTAILTNVINSYATNINTLTIGFNGDSTGQGVEQHISNFTINNEGLIFEGCVGGENVFATAARQGSIPLVVMPFTIPATSKARWSNYTGNIVEDGNDPEITITPSMMYEVTDNNGNVMSQIYPLIYFDASYPFYATLAGVEGYIYSLGEYEKQADGTYSVDNSVKHTYFHRLEPGEEKNIADTCHTVSKDQSLWKRAYNINMMGTNGGFLNFDDNGVITGLVSSEQRARNLFKIQKTMSAYCGGKYLVVGMFCESNWAYDKPFYEEYERLCEEYFGSHFLNARKLLIEEVWKELGITLTEYDKENMQKGLAPWSLFGKGDGLPADNPHLTRAASKVLTKHIMERVKELGWVKETTL